MNYYVRLLDFFLFQTDMQLTSNYLVRKFKFYLRKLPNYIIDILLEYERIDQTSKL